MAIVVCSGPGYKNAGRAAQQAIAEYSPEMMVSIGFAGALAPEMKVGDIFVPRHIISERTGSAFTSARGQGVLVTAERVAGRGAQAPAVHPFQRAGRGHGSGSGGREAATRGCEFLALKVISDDAAHSNVEFVSPFVRPEGFRAGAFLAHLSIRPWLWPAVHNLQRDSARAAENLCAAVRVLVSKGREVLEELYSPALQADVKGN